MTDRQIAAIDLGIDKLAANRDAYKRECIALANERDELRAALRRLLAAEGLNRADPEHYSNAP